VFFAHQRRLEMHGADDGRQQPMDPTPTTFIWIDVAIAAVAISFAFAAHLVEIAVQWARHSHARLSATPS
jgi:hypothetical protein